MQRGRGVAMALKKTVVLLVVDPVPAVHLPDYLDANADVLKNTDWHVCMNACFDMMQDLVAKYETTCVLCSNYFHSYLELSKHALLKERGWEILCHSDLLRPDLVDGPTWLTDPWARRPARRYGVCRTGVVRLTLFGARTLLSSQPPFPASRICSWCGARCCGWGGGIRSF